jgi:hypothetical protein
VANLRRRLGLDQEALRRGVVALRVLFAEHLDGDALVDDRVAASIDVAHASLSQQGLHFVAAIDGGAEQRVDLRGGLDDDPTRGELEPVHRAVLHRVRVVHLALPAGLHGPQS